LVYKKVFFSKGARKVFLKYKNSSYAFNKKNFPKDFTP
jgi:hypothetical protein